MSGPQAERDKNKPIGGNDENSYFSSNTLPQTGDMLNMGNAPVVAERNMYEAELAKSRKENAFLRDQTNRLTSELRAFQVQYPYAGASGGVPPPPVDLPPWMSSENVMSPLFSAYDSRINDLASLTEQQRMALDSFAEEIEKLVTENELLRNSQLKDLKADMDRITLDGGAAASSSSRPNQALHDGQDVEERFGILMEENSLMAEQNALLSKELEKSQEEIMMREQNIINLTQSMSDAAEAMQGLEAENVTLNREKKECEASLLMKTNECTSLSESTRKAISEMKAAVQLKNEAVMREDELRSDNKELDTECQDMSDKVRLAANKVNELKGKLAAKTLEADRAGESLRRTTNELNRVRTDAENMVSVMDGMEKQLTEFQAREEGVSQLSRECKEKVEDAILARDQANAICTSLRREVAKLLEQRKKSIEDTSNQHETVIDTIKSKLQLTIDKKERTCHELTISNAKLKVEAERSRREKQTAVETYVKLRETLEGERAGLKSKFDHCSKRIWETEARLEAETATGQHVAEQVRTLTKDFQEKDLMVADLTANAEKERMEYQHVIDGLRKELRDKDGRLEGKQFEMDKMNLLIAEARNTAKHRMQDTVNQLTAEVEDLKLAAESARAYGRDRENAVQEQMEQHGKNVERIRAEKEIIVSQLEKKLSEEREVGSRMTGRNQELGVRVNVLASEKAELSVMNAEAEDRLEGAERELVEAEERCRELGEKLKENMEEQQRRIKEEGKLKAEITKLQREKGRGGR
ncbi:hypothetical protein TrCOL_g7454 [Triparma columacea]|uniref:Uncharacterized protein n=1 Tax=Triparma columacea TaxID=722753 RepID=A0A9W7G1A7_9STRA|nr:hypothetical protein TrCOL_g7454 [Triparma columacea]